MAFWKKFLLIFIKYLSSSVFDEAYNVFELLIKTLSNSLTKEIIEVKLELLIILIKELVMYTYGLVYNQRQNLKAIIIIL